MESPDIRWRDAAVRSGLKDAYVQKSNIEEKEKLDREIQALENDIYVISSPKHVSKNVLKMPTVSVSVSEAETKLLSKLREIEYLIRKEPKLSRIEKEDEEEYKIRIQQLKAQADAKIEEARKKMDEILAQPEPDGPSPAAPRAPQQLPPSRTLYDILEAEPEPEPVSSLTQEELRAEEARLVAELAELQQPEAAEAVAKAKAKAKAENSMSGGRKCRKTKKRKSSKRKTKKRRTKKNKRSKRKSKRRR